MAEKFLERNATSGKVTENEGLQVSSGAGDAGKIPALNSSGQIDITMMPPGVGASTQAVLASENLSAGDFVNIYDNAGTANVRKADSTVAGRRAHGYVLSAVLSGNTATIYFEGKNDQLSGIVAGDRLYLGALGAVINTVPAMPTNLFHQYLGNALSTTSADIELDDEIVLA